MQVFSMFRISMLSFSANTQVSEYFSSIGRQLLPHHPDHGSSTMLLYLRILAYCVQVVT